MTEREAIKQFKERIDIPDYKEQIPEYYEAMEMAINALENQEKIKSIITDKKKQYRQGWEEIERIVKGVMNNDLCRTT